MGEDSVILEKLSTLEAEIAALAKRLDPVLLSSSPTANATSDPQPARSNLHSRVVYMIDQVKDLQSRIEL